MQLNDREFEGKQGQLTDFIRDRHVVTNLPQSWPVEDVIDETYLRCDQENVIEQLGSGLAMWRTPVKECAGNEAWPEIGHSVDTAPQRARRMRIISLHCRSKVAAAALKMLGLPTHG